MIISYYTVVVQKQVNFNKTNLHKFKSEPIKVKFGNVSPLRGEKPKNRPMSKNNSGRVPLQYYLQYNNTPLN